MSDNTLLAIVLSALIVSCNAPTIIDHIIPQPKPTVQEVCVRAAWTQADRIECIKAAP